MRWESATGSASVELSRELIQTLRGEVYRGVQALPRRGAEVGGLLLGRFSSSNETSVRVESIEPVSCEHRFGPSFILSDNDRTGLEQMLAAYESDEEVAVVGYYRSCTGRDIELDEADEELARMYFTDPRQVFLLIKPLSLRECIAAYFYKERGRFLTEGQPSFSLNAEYTSAPTVPEEPAVQPSAPIPPAETRHFEPPIVEPPMVVPDTVRHRRRARREEGREEEEKQPGRLRRLLLTFVAFVAMVGLAFFLGWLNPARGPRFSDLGLNVHQTSNGLEVVWDGAKAASQDARRGVLSITDGASENAVELNRAALERGKFVYEPASNDVLVRLSIYGPAGQPAGESFRVVVVPQKTSPPAKAAPAIEPPPQIAPAPPSVNAARHVKAEAPRMPPPPTAKPARQQTPAASAIAVPAKATHEVRPGISEGIRSRIRGTVVVGVEVRIDATGKVTSAVSQGRGDVVYTYLASRAEEAAKLWRFEPARTKDGTRVASTKTVYFVFKG